MTVRYFRALHYALQVNTDCRLTEDLAMNPASTPTSVSDGSSIRQVKLSSLIRVNYSDMLEIGCVSFSSITMQRSKKTDK